MSELFSGRIVFPEMVMQELRRAHDERLLKRCHELIESGAADIWDIDTSSDALPLYIEMTSGPVKAIGKGEASALALAKVHGGTLASNNLRDIGYYVKRFGIDFTTTAGILIEAYDDGIIDEREGNEIWSDMLAHGRMLGASSFTDYLKNKPINPIF